MKEVITNRNEDFVMLDEVSEKYFYGVVYGLKKGFVLRDIKTGTWDVRSTSDMYNNYVSRGHISLSAAAERLVNMSCYEGVYQFDTAQELFDWLGE